MQHKWAQEDYYMREDKNKYVFSYPETLVTWKLQNNLQSQLVPFATSIRTLSKRSDAPLDIVELVLQ